jgi:hypothetical protein
MTNYKQKLRECRSCAEAKPIMEAMGMGASQKQLMDYYYQLRVSKDPRQQAHGENAYATAIREADEENNNKHEEMENNNHDKEQEANGGLHRDQGGEADIAGIIKGGQKEADEITGELDSHQSSDIDMPYPKEGTDAPENDIESMQGGASAGTSQMGGIKEGMNGMLPQMPQAPGMPPMAPEVQQAMAPKMPQIPQMNTPMAMRQMQYTVEQNNKRLFNRVINPLIREVKKLREANIALDHKVQETQSNAGTMKLDLDKVRANSPVKEHRLRETIPGTSIEVPEMTHPRAELENKRYEIAQLDKELQKAKPFYQ